jgi:hypothetical protein
VYWPGGVFSWFSVGRFPYVVLRFRFYQCFLSLRTTVLWTCRRDTEYQDLTELFTAGRIHSIAPLRPAQVYNPTSGLEQVQIACAPVPFEWHDSQLVLTLDGAATYEMRVVRPHSSPIRGGAASGTGLSPGG